MGRVKVSGVDSALWIVGLSGVGLSDEWNTGGPLGGEPQCLPSSNLSQKSTR